MQEDRWVIFVWLEESLYRSMQYQHDCLDTLCWAIPAQEKTQETEVSPSIEKFNCY